MEALTSVAVWCDKVAFTRHFVFVGYKTLESYRSSGGHLTGTDAYFGTETVPESVRKIG